MLDFCLGCSNKKCWVWFLALNFLLLTFLYFCGNPYVAIQPVKTSIFDHRKIAFDVELACYWPVFLHSSCSNPAECKFEKVWGSKICTTVQLARGTSSYMGSGLSLKHHYLSLVGTVFVDWLGKEKIVFKAYDLSKLSKKPVIKIELAGLQPSGNPWTLVQTNKQTNKKQTTKHLFLANVYMT